MATIHINNRSDFQILLKAEEGKTFPEFDFTLAFQTTGGFRYNVMSNDSKRFTPNADRTQAVITFDFANCDYFPNGRLAYTIKAEMQNSMFADGYENTQTPRLLDVIIWDGASDYSDAVEVDFVLPYVSVQAKSISPALLDTSNIIRKRLPYGAMAYQLYYTQLIRVPNALAAQEEFDDKVPQWFSEFLKRYVLKGRTRFSIPVWTSGDSNSLIGEISITTNESTGVATYDTKITFTASYPSGGCLFFYFVLQAGVYYFDANRNLRVYCDEHQYRQAERFLPNEPKLSDVKRLYKYSDEGFCFIPKLGGLQIDHERYVRRRKNFGTGKEGKVRWYYYWRKTNRLRQISNAPVKKSKKYGTKQICLVRLRNLTYYSENIYKKGCRVAARSKWAYFNIQVSGSTGKISVRYSRER